MHDFFEEIDNEILVLCTVLFIGVMVHGERLRMIWAMESELFGADTF